MLKKRLNNIKLISLFLVITFLLLGCQSASQEGESVAESEEVGSEEVVDTSEENGSSSDYEVVDSVTIRSIGDVLVHDTVYYDADTGDGYSFEHMFDGVRPYLENADITTANLEMITAGSVFGPSTYPAFNSPEEIIDALQNAGVDIVNNATNHSLDLGADGAYASINALQERDMMYVGSYESWEDYNTSRIIEVGDMSVGFLSYANDANGNYLPEDQEYLLSLIDLDLIPLEVEQLNTEVDVSVVMFHMGNEYDYLPNTWQLEVMQTARDAGANFILGGHPHVLQPFINYNESQAGMFSHGNFLTGQYEIDTKVGGITEYTFNKLGNGEVVLDSMRFMPTFNFGMPETPVYSVVPLADADEYGLAQASELYAELEQRMRYYTNKVEVVEYLD